MGSIFLIVSSLLVISLIVSNVIYSNKKKKEALDAKPKDNRIYKVFEVEYEGSTYYVVRRYRFWSTTNRHEWELYGDYKSYKDTTKDQAIELCDNLNEVHLKNINNKKMTKMLEDRYGNMIH